MVPFRTRFNFRRAALVNRQRFAVKQVWCCQRTAAVIEIEVQNETYQSQEKVRFAAVPRIGEGIRLLEPNGFWASFDVLDVWYQKAEFGDIWVPFLHVRKTADEAEEPPVMQQEPVRFAI